MDESSTDKGARWLVFPCPACGDPVKIPKAKARRRVGCPHCHAALSPNVEAAATGESTLAGGPMKTTGEGETEQEDEAPRSENVRDEEVESVAPAEFSDWVAVGEAEDREASREEAQYSPDARAERAETRLKKMRRRVKKRAKLSVTTPEWDMTDEEVDEIEGADDGEEFDTSYVEVDPSDPTKLRRKKTRRKKNLTTSQKLFQRAATAVGLAGLVLAAVIGVFGIAGALGLKSKEENRRDEINRENLANMRLPRPGAPEDTEPKAAKRVLARYLAAATVEEKLKYVRFPELMHAKMAKFYERHPIEPTDEFTLKYTSLQSLGDKSRVLFQVKYVDGTVQNYVLEKMESNSEEPIFKVEWEVSEGWMPMTWEQFRQRRSIASVPMRVEILPAEYYHAEFADDEEYTSYEIRYNDELVGMYGFMSKDDPESVYLDGLLEFEQTGLKVIADLRYPEDSSDWNMVIIDRIRQLQWVVDYSKTVASGESAGGAL